MTQQGAETLDEQFAEILVHGETILATGSPWHPENEPGIPPALVSRLRAARQCLTLLDALWSRLHS